MSARLPRRPRARVVAWLLLPVLAHLVSGAWTPIDAQKRRGKDAKTPEPFQPWLGDFDTALEQSLERNAPLLILAILEGEETSDRVRDEIYHGKEFRKAAEGSIVLLTNNGTHKTKEIEVETKTGKVKRKVCSMFETPSCRDHQRSMDRVYQEYHIEGEFIMPHLIAILPGGKIHDRFQDEIQIADSVRIAEAVRAAAGPSLSAEELTTVKGKLAELASFEKARLWVSAWRAGTAVLEVTEVATYAEPAQAGIDRALAAMRDEVANAVKQVEGGEVEAGYLKLLKLRDEHVGTPLEKPTRDRVKKLERDKRFKDAIKKVQRKLEAEEIWAKVEEAVAKDKPNTAERHAKKLIEKFGDTPAGKRAAERYPHLVPADG